jgi:hypothetical protein
VARRKSLIVLLAFLLLLGGCANEAATAASPQSTDSAVITAFLQDMLAWKGVYWSKLETTYKNTAYAKALAGLNAPDYTVTILPMYDILSITQTGNGRVEGKLMVSGIPAYRQVSGNTTEFGFDYTYPADDSFLYPAGTVEIAKGSFSAAKNTLRYEDIVTNGGKTLARTVIEIIKNADGAYLMQYLYSGEDQKGVACVVTQVKKDSFTAFAGTREGDTAFEYASILNGAALETMKSGMTLSLSAFADASRAEVK